MRNFEERMQEIQKRSRARIIRRRKQLTALFVPLMAALCIGGTLIRQHISDPYDHIATTSTSLPQYFGCVTVIDQNKRVLYNDRDTVDAVCHLLSNLLPANEIATGEDQQQHRDVTIQATSLGKSYTIILETEGEVMHYRLTAMMLINQDTDERYVLSDVQHASLLAILDIH